MELARKIADDDELRAIAAAGNGFVFDPFWRKWHQAACPHVRRMTTGQPKWFARSRADLEEFERRRLAQYPAAKPFVACATCGSQADMTSSADAEAPAPVQAANDFGWQTAPISAALREIISEHGPAVLPSPAQIASLIADLLPEKAGIGKMLAAAAEEHSPSGCVHVLDNPETGYLRWTDPDRCGPAVIYFKKADLWFVMTEDLATLSDLPAGTTSVGGCQHNVRFPISPSTTGQILEGARAPQTMTRGPCATCNRQRSRAARSSALASTPAAFAGGPAGSTFLNLLNGVNI